MSQIIPSINVSTFEEVQERIKKIEPFVKWCHLDVTDGIFSKHITWHEPMDLPLIQTKLNIEVHLMIKKPEEILNESLQKKLQLSEIDSVQLKGKNIAITLKETEYRKYKKQISKLGLDYDKITEYLLNEIYE